MPNPRYIYFNLVKFAWANAGLSKRRMVVFYGLLIAANIAVSLQPVALASIIKSAQYGGPDALPAALKAAAVYGFLTLTFWALHGPARVIERRVAFEIYQNFVTKLYRTVTELPLRWHQDHHSGSTINRVNKAGRALFSFSQTQFIIIQTATRFTLALVALCYYSWWVAATSLMVSLAVVLLVRRFDRHLLPLVRSTNERDHHLNAALYDYIGNIITVLTLRLQDNTDSEILHRFRGMRPTFWREVLLNETKWGTINILLILTQVTLIGSYVAVQLAHNTTPSLGPIVAIFQYLLSINQQFFQGMTILGDLLNQHTDVHGVDALLEDHQRLILRSDEHRQHQWRHIDIRNLSFTHAEGEDALHHLHAINFSISAGEKIALVGESGSGKTTLLTLLRGLYDAPQVELTLDGQLSSSLQPLSGFTTLIPQDTEVFENTVHYNITLGTEVSPETIQNLIHQTTFDDVIVKLPHGLETDIRERGVNLSGGQKQRLALTRGLVAAQTSSLLLLDEPTSNMDLATESIIFDRIFSANRTKTIIASIHRLHLLPRFDLIVLMQDGTILEQGSLTDLIARQGAFYHLWQQHLVSATPQS